MRSRASRRSRDPRRRVPVRFTFVTKISLRFRASPRRPAHGAGHQHHVPHHARSRHTHIRYLYTRRRRDATATATEDLPLTTLGSTPHAPLVTAHAHKMRGPPRTAIFDSSDRTAAAAAILSTCSPLVYTRHMHLTADHLGTPINKRSRRTRTACFAPQYLTLALTGREDACQTHRPHVLRFMLGTLRSRLCRASPSSRRSHPAAFGAPAGSRPAFRRRSRPPWRSRSRCGWR